MWRFAKRFAVKAARSTGRNTTATARSGPAQVVAEEKATRAAKDQCRARSTQTCEGLVQLRARWEVEAAANARRKWGAEPGDDATRVAIDMVKALRHAGCGWTDIATHPAVRREIGHAIGAAWANGASLSGITAGVRAAQGGVRELVGPTFALRHAGGSWRDVVSHPASKLLPYANRVLGPLRAECGAKLEPFVSSFAKRSASTARRKPGSSRQFPAVKHHYELLESTPVSSADALRHAGASWIDVVTHHAFRSCFTNRAKAATYAAYLATFVRHPFPTALVTSVGKCVASDIAVQTLLEGKRLDEVDKRRVFCFFALGLTYVGAFQYGLYNRLMKPAGDFLTKRAGVSASVATMVVIDQFVVCPVISLPTFFGLKSFANGECGVTEVPGRIADKMTVTEYDAGEWMTMTAMWAYWMPAQAINFWIVPRHLTIPFMNLLGFGWNAIMSAMNGSKIGGSVTEAEKAIVVKASDVAAAVLSESEECLKDDGCIRALELATGDAMTIARVAHEVP